MKKLSVFCAALVLALVSCSGSGPDYRELIANYTENIDITGKFAKSLDDAKTAEDIIAALEKFGALLKVNRDAAMAISVEHPEYRDATTVASDDLKKTYSDFVLQQKKLSLSIQNSMNTHSTNPKVSEAFNTFLRTFGVAGVNPALGQD